MKIYTEVVWQYNKDTDSYERVSESFYDHEGPIALCGGGGKGGGGGGYSPPPAPDPAAVAAAQGGQDRATAATNALLLNPSINSPYGQVSYDTNSYNVDPSNTQVNRPTQTITLSPAQQQELDAKNTVSGILSGVGINLANQLPNNALIGPDAPQRPTNIDYSNVGAVPSMSDYSADATKASQAYYDQQYALMAPDMNQQQKLLQNNLIQSGNPVGSEAYDTQTQNYQRQRDASLTNLSNEAVSQGYNLQNQLFNNANTANQQQIAMDQLPYNTANQIRGDTINENQTLRNQNIDELSALLQGTQAINLPTGSQYNQQALTPPNIAGYTYQNYNNQLNSYNQMYAQQQAQNNASGNAFTSGLFSLGSSALGLFG